MALLTGKVALVTGGGRGIGEATARTFAAEGAKIIVADIMFDNAKKVADDIKANGGEAEALEFNVADFAHIKEKVDAAKAMFGRIDILANVAGIASFDQIEDVTEQSWDRMMNINLKGTFFISQAVFEIMKEQKYGKMIFLSSVAAWRAGKSSDVTYAASKAGIANLAICFAQKGAEYGITSNTVAPGNILTDMGRACSWSQADPKLTIPMGYFGEAQDVANCLLFYASDLSKYVTGDRIHVNGGLYISW